MKKIAFIFNPISGGSRLIHVVPLIKRHINKAKYDYVFETTQYRGHAKELAQKYAWLGYDAVLAIGGDGTVNEVASGLVSSRTALGIIPCGSGNGLARHIGIPMDPYKAIKWLDQSHIVHMDYGMINDQPFFCTCGVGFDAAISKSFSEAGTRGILTYLESIVKEIAKYRNETYHLFIDGVEQEYSAFIVTCANAGQWGNNAFIAPQASITDGLLDIAIIPSFTVIDIPIMAIQLFNRQLDKNRNVRMLRCRELKIVREKPGVAHFDGDPIMLGTEINIKIVPGSLNIIVPNKPRTV